MQICDLCAEYIAGLIETFTDGSVLLAREDNLVVVFALTLLLGEVSHAGRWFWSG